MYTCERLAGTHASTIGNFKRYVFFADKIFVIRPYRFKFISVMECIRDEFIFQGLHVTIHTVVNLVFCLVLQLTHLCIYLTRNIGVQVTMRGDLEYPLYNVHWKGVGGGGYCYLLLCIDFRNYLIFNMKKKRRFFFF